MISAVAQKLVNQVTIGGMDFHTIETSVEAYCEATRYCSMMPGISLVSKARGVTTAQKPSSVKAFPTGLIADGATGNSPFGCSAG